MAYSKDYVNKAKSILIEEISIGFSVLEIGRRYKKDIPSRDTIYKWLREDAAFADNYARAKQDSADVDADKVKEIADGVLDGTYDASAARVAMDAYKWAAGKKKPKVYGDRVDVNNTGEITHNVKPFDIRDIYKADDSDKA